MTISLPKSKVMTCKGQVPITSNILIDNTVIEQVNTFAYLGHKNK
jgi:hypothetical protein